MSRWFQGLVPDVPDARERDGNGYSPHETRAVPDVPGVPVPENGSGEREAEPGRTPEIGRAILFFRLSDAPDCWPVVVGAPGETAEEVAANLRGRYGERLLETRPYQPNAPRKDAALTGRELWNE